MQTNHQWILTTRPCGMAKESDFTWKEARIPSLKEDEYLVRTIYLSIDPTNRIWMSEVPAYMPPVQLGEVMRGFGVGQVVESKNASYSPGAYVSGQVHWQEYVVGTPEMPMTPLPPGVPLPTCLNVFSVTGMTAYFGVLDIGRPKSGETVVVSGAAGATGSVAGQIAKIKGCRVVGTAGTDEKCEWTTKELGFDACINYRKGEIAERLKDFCPQWIDIYYDNVGGEILNTALRQINIGARIVICGGISGYNSIEDPLPGPSNYLELVNKRARMEGFLILDYIPRFGEAGAQLGQWMAEGKIKSREHIVDGLNNAPSALRMLFEGKNIGKMMVRVAPEQV